MDRLHVDDGKIKVMLQGDALAEGKTVYEQAPARSVLRLVLPKPEEEAEGPAATEDGKKEKISEARGLTNVR